MINVSTLFHFFWVFFHISVPRTFATEKFINHYLSILSMKILKVIRFNYKIILSFVAMVSLFSFLFSFSFAKSDDEIELPIIMYHSLLKSQKSTYIVHPNIFEEDLKYIQSKGYSTITMTELINYVYNDASLPEKPIIITFDDGYYNNLSYAVPLLHKYNMKAVVSIVGEYSDRYTESDEANPNYGYLRWKDINELITDGCIEFQNHTYNSHSMNNGRNGCKKTSSESAEHYSNFLSNDLNKLQEEFRNNCNGYQPNTFTYPFGAVSKESNSIVKDLGFKASLSCTSGINIITKDPNCLYLLKRNNRVPEISTEQFFMKLLN